MLKFILFFILHFTGSLGVQKPDTHINRNQVYISTSHGAYSPHPRRQYLEDNQIIENNDYDDYSGGFNELRPPMQVVHAAKATSDGKKNAIKIHQPREDPKLFYQSEAYLKEISGQNINHEVASIYPGREVIRAGETFRVPKHLLRSGQPNRVKSSRLCIRCPNDRTLIAKTGVNKVIFQSPTLTTCAGRKAPRNVRLVHMYGPKFGSLLQHGSHVVVGRIMRKNETIQLCKMQVHVIAQSCPTPTYLISHCTNKHTPCNLTCRDETLELQGKSQIYCGEDMKWASQLPVCRVRNWCRPLPPPDIGKVSCRGVASTNNQGLSEGSRCRIRCPTGWRWYPKGVSVCRRGSWTNILKCQLKKRIL